MKIPCSVIRDLLPLYAEKMVEPETENLVAEHLADCSDCREKLSAMKEKAEPAIETAKPLLNLKKQIRRRRWRAVAIAALCVFIILFTCFYHTSKLNMLPWKEGLIKVKGVEIVSPENRLGRTYYMLYGEYNEKYAPVNYTGEALVLITDSSIAGTMCTSFRDDDGTLTVVLQGIGRDSYSMNAGGAARELGLYPVPDRVIYDGGNSQELLWGEPLNGGTEVLPRLALAYYLLIAASMAAVSGLLWFIFRGKKAGKIMRQVFFAPAAYIAAHLLLKGTATTSYFMGRELYFILMIAIALYFLFTLAWRVWLQRRKER